MNLDERIRKAQEDLGYVDADKDEGRDILRDLVRDVLEEACAVTCERCSNGMKLEDGYHPKEGGLFACYAMGIRAHLMALLPPAAEATAPAVKVARCKRCGEAVPAPFKLYCSGDCQVASLEENARG